MSKSETKITFRVTYEFKARLEAQAEKEHRPVANLIHKVMEEYLEQQEAESPSHRPAGGDSPL